MAKKKSVDKRDMQKKEGHPRVAPRLTAVVKKNRIRPGSKPGPKGKKKKEDK